MGLGCRSAMAFPQHHPVTPAVADRPSPGTAASSRQPPATGRPRPSRTGRRPGTRPSHPAATTPRAAGSAEAVASAVTCTAPSRTPPQPPSMAATDHHTPGSTAGPSSQTPRRASSSSVDLPASLQEHSLSLFFFFRPRTGSLTWRIAGRGSGLRLILCSDQGCTGSDEGREGESAA